MYATKKRRPSRAQRIIRLYVLTLMLILTLSLAALLAQTAKAKTYVITDGERVVTYTTFATDPAQILGQAGLELAEQDSFTTAAHDDGRTIEVRRAQRITVSYHGQIVQTTSLGETAGELLDRLNLEVTGEDTIDPGLDTQTYDGMELRVDRMETRQEVYMDTIAHEVRHCNDPTRPLGSREVLIEGQDGQVLCTAGVTYRNGEEHSRTLLGQTVIQMPTTELVSLGTGPAPEDQQLEIADGYIRLPTGEVLTYSRTDTVRATAYTHTDPGCDQITATGTQVRRGTVAVDPRYIPYGTRMFIAASDGSYIYGIATAEDCGGDIKGDRMDLYMPTVAECMDFGRRRCTLYFLD